MKNMFANHSLLDSVGTATSVARFVNSSSIVDYYGAENNLWMVKW